MKKKIIVVCAVILVVIAIVISVIVVTKDNESDNDLPDEGVATLIKSETWISKVDGTEHKVDSYTLGSTAQDVAETADSLVVNHKFVDDIPIYEVYDKDKNAGNMLFFFHGQMSQKEEFLNEMELYAEAGYCCVSIDLQCHGERKNNVATMALQITADTGKDIDTLIEYYQTVNYANSEKFALIGFSQGGSIAYWYAAFGKYVPSAIVVGSTTPDYNYQETGDAIKNGEFADSLWSDEEISAFIAENNPIDHTDKFANLPILSGNGLSDTIIPTTGSEELEKIMYEFGNENAQFYYFENVGHDVTEGFIQKILPFVKEYV